MTATGQTSPADRPATTGTVVAGHGVASGRSADSPFAAGTIALQTPHLAARGLDISGYHPATINLDVAPVALRLLTPRHTFTDVRWTDVHAAETFSFVDMTTTWHGRAVSGLVYHPHPETKPAHEQPGTVVELLLPHLDGLGYGDTLTITLAAGQADFLPAGGTAE